MTVVEFVPRAELSADDKLAAFIAYCRDELTVFGADLGWDVETWDISDYVTRVGKSAKITLWWRHVGRHNYDWGPPLGKPFVDFAKAHLRYTHGQAPRKNYGSRLTAYRALEKALGRDGTPPSLSRVTLDILNRAAADVKNAHTAQLAYRVGVELEKIVGFAEKKGLIQRHINWKNPIRRPPTGDRIGPQAEAASARKLPENGAIEALGRAFYLAEEPRDVMATSVAAILLGTNSRISELYRIDVNSAERFETAPDGSERYGLQWKPSKGANEDVRWIPTVMVDVIRQAFDQLKDVSSAARQLAAFYEDYPDRIPFPPELADLADKEYLPVNRIRDFVSGDGKRFLLRHKIERHKLRTAKGVRDFIRASDLNRVFRSYLPRNFPYADVETGLKLRDSIFIGRAVDFEKRLQCQTWRIRFLDQGVFWGLMGNKNGAESVFERLNIRMDDGSMPKVRAHQIRHLLSTIGTQGGLSNLDLSRWAGRRDIRENTVYDHTPNSEIVAAARNLDQEVLGESAVATVREPTTPAEILAREAKVSHQTEYGICEHDFAALPCQLHRDCLNCTEHVCIKGDEAKSGHIRKQLEIARRGLEAAEAATAEGAARAQRWIEHQRRSVERLEALVTILDDPTVPVGTRIRLDNAAEGDPLAIAQETRFRLEDGGASMLSTSVGSRGERGRHHLSQEEDAGAHAHLAKARNVLGI